MPTVQEIHEIAPIAQYLASNDVSNGALFGQRPNPNIAIQIYLIRKPVEWLYALEGIADGATPSASLTQTSNWLFSWLGQYGLQALNLINAGGVIPNPSQPTTIYGLPITGVYVAVNDGEYVLNLKTEAGDNLPAGAKVVFAEKAIRVLTSSQYNYVAPNLTLLGGIVMSAEEELFFEYVVPVYGAPSTDTNSYVLANSVDFLLINSTDKFII